MMIRMLGLLGLSLIMLLLTACQIKPTLSSASVGCHSQHINCERFDYDSLGAFKTSLAAHIERWHIKVHTAPKYQPRNRLLHARAAQLYSLEDYKVAIRDYPGDIYLLVKQAKQEGFTAYETYLMEQAYLRSITDWRQFLRNK